MRHVWHLNVNESLSIGFNCNIGNLQQHDIGLDLTINNLNQVHHPLMTEIFPNELTLYCSAYKFSQKKPIFMQSPGYVRVFKNGAGLRTTESMSVRISLEEREPLGKSTSSFEFIQNRLSTIALKNEQKQHPAITMPPALNQLSSFLMKHETKYIGVLGQTVTGEEFNNIVSMQDSHMTLALSWRAVISDNNSVQRITYGQHFVQLRKLYET